MPFKDLAKRREMGNIYSRRYYESHRRHPREPVLCPTRICEGCGQPYERRSNQRPVKFNASRFCTSACDLAHRTVRQDDEGGRSIARKLYPLEPCEVCGSLRAERHHIDSDRLNNARSNIGFLCRRHHKAAHKASDGRVGGGARPAVVARQIVNAKTRLRDAQQLRATGRTWQQVADELGIHVNTIHRLVRKYGPDTSMGERP